MEKEDLTEEKEKEMDNTYCGELPMFDATVERQRKYGVITTHDDEETIKRYLQNTKTEK